MVRFEVRNKNVRIVRNHGRARIVSHQEAVLILRELLPDVKWIVVCTQHNLRAQQKRK